MQWHACPYGSCAVSQVWSGGSAGLSACLVAEGSGSSRCKLHVCGTMLQSAACKQSPGGCSQSGSCPCCLALIVLQRLACLPAIGCLECGITAAQSCTVCPSCLQNFSFSATQTFTTPPPVGPTSTVYVLDTADMGHAEVDGSNEWEDDRPQR